MVGKNLIFNFYLTDTGQEYDFNNACLRMAINSLGKALKIRVVSVKKHRYNMINKITKYDVY